MLARCQNKKAAQRFLLSTKDLSSSFSAKHSIFSPLILDLCAQSANIFEFRFGCGVYAHCVAITRRLFVNRDLRQHQPDLKPQKLPSQRRPNIFMLVWKKKNVTYSTERIGSYLLYFNVQLGKIFEIVLQKSLNSKVKLNTCHLFPGNPKLLRLSVATLTLYALSKSKSRNLKWNINSWPITPFSIVKKYFRLNENFSYYTTP